MLIPLDFSSEQPIYMQIRNAIVTGIAEGKLQPGEKLPPIRSFAEEAGINMMTVHKAYQLLKQEGFISTDRRSGAHVSLRMGDPLCALEGALKQIFQKARMAGASRQEIMNLCEKLLEEGKEMQR